MTTNPLDRIINEIRIDKSSVLVLSNRKQFEYSDGKSSERYLKSVFSRSKDLSSNSYELERWIKDWGSEYHLSRKRSQLLRGFDFDKTKKVLEVGCGCGAITRFLGETFDDVVSIEGSLERAKLARMRTKDMENVSILCGAFQDIQFKDKFDIVFCVGVLEYSGMYVSSNDPYNSVLEYLSNLLNPDGVLVLAIENQFGLKYFSSSKEDHTKRMFDGIEGYPYTNNNIRTFGYAELKSRINMYFSDIDFYFPCPDYKMPLCVLSEYFINNINAGELIGRYKSRDYSGDKKPLFDEALAYLEIDKNNMLKHFVNSYLVIAGKKEIKSIKTQALCVLYSAGRAEYFQTITRFIEHADKSVWAYKQPTKLNASNSTSALKLHPISCKWEAGLSLNGVLTYRVKDKCLSFEELFAPCKIWINKLHTISSIEGDKRMIEGKYIDCIWENTYIRDGECIFVDQEWEWHDNININVIILRAIYCFLNKIYYNSDMHPFLKKGCTIILMNKIAKSLGIRVCKDDYRSFVELEAKFKGIVGDGSTRRIKISIVMYLLNNKINKNLLYIEKYINNLYNIIGRILNYVMSIFLPR